VSGLEFLLLGVVALLVLATAALAAADTVLDRIGVVRALALDEEGRGGAEALLWLVEHPAIGSNALLLLTVAARVAAAGIVAALTLAAGGPLTAVALAALVVAMFVLAEVGPRTYTVRRLERTGLLLAPTVRVLARLLDPVVRLLVRTGDAIGGRSGDDPASADERIRQLARSPDGGEDAEIEEDERAMIHSILELGDTVCREIMSPRPDMVTVSVDDPLETVVDVALENGHSRIPVHRGEVDDVIGIVYAKDLLKRIHDEKRAQSAGGLVMRGSWTDLIREPTFVPESRRADELLRDLQRQKVHLAIVVDEHGGIAGLVTIEDILEEIVGEIVDEYDQEQPPVVRLDDRRLRVTARVTVHDLNELLGSALPEEEGWDTVGGLLIGLLGRVPQPGESVQVDGLTLVAERVQGRRVSEVLITRVENGADRERERVP
jgi:CBS domain containing-hemolysin-like protein